MRKNYIWIFLIQLICEFIFFGIVHAAESDFGMVFDIQGDIEIRSSGGKSIKLTREKHILHKVKEGDRIKVKKGKVVIVSLKENKGYELASKSEGLIKGLKMTTVKGTINITEGHSRSPVENLIGEFGAMVSVGRTINLTKDNPPEDESLTNMAVKDSANCIELISPVNTSIIELTPELRWKYNCGEIEKAGVKISGGDEAIWTADSSDSFIKVPEGILEHGKEYIWIVDGNSMSNTAKGIFIIPEKDKIERIMKEVVYFKKRGNNLSERLFYVSYLIENNLNEMVMEELMQFQKEFPDNNYIKELAENLKTRNQ